MGLNEGKGEEGGGGGGRRGRKGGRRQPAVAVVAAPAGVSGSQRAEAPLVQRQGEERRSGVAGRGVEPKRRPKGSERGGTNRGREGRER